MKIYLIDNENVAIGVRQLLQLSAACATVRWSKFLKKRPTDLIQSFDVIENYADEILTELCDTKNAFYVLNENDERELFDSYKKSETLKKTAGSGVILASEFDSVRGEINQEPQLKFLIEALCNEKNLLII